MYHCTEPRLPAYTDAEIVYQCGMALAGVVADMAEMRVRHATDAAQDAWDCLSLAVEAIAALG